MSSFKYDDILIDYYPAKVYDTTLLGSASLSDFLAAHKNPKKEILEIFKKIEQAAAIGDIKEKDRLKQNNLFYFTPTCSMRGNRDYQSIVQFHPLMVVEFDKIDFAEELKKELFERLKCCIAAYLSPSKKGVKILIRIPVAKSIDEYKEYFCSIAYYLSRIKGFDPANFNPSLPTFLSYDFDILIRPENEVEEWNLRGGKINAFKLFEGDFIPPEDINEEDKQEVIRIVKNCFKKIDDNAHPKVVSFSSLLGGYVASGYISFEDARDLLFELIEENDYMRKNVKGYCKTAQEMLQRGTVSPLLLKRHQDGEIL